MTVAESYARALSDKKQALAKKAAAHDKAIKELSEKDSEYRKTCALLAECGNAYAINAFGGDKKVLAALKEQMQELSLKKADILKRENISDIEYDCPLCLDTGYKDGKMCECVKSAAKRIYVEELSREFPLESNTFENFNLDFYDEDDAKKRMTVIYKLCVEYVNNFDEKRDNLLFIGATGLGKTHLTLAIVGELLKRGYEVIYGSAYNLFAKMEREHFETHTTESFDAAISCDLLCIDDLGSEFVSPFVQTLVYNIINTRMLANKPTIISTNLSMNEIETRYTERVSSRLIGGYVSKKFLGKDIRQQKAFAQNK